MVGQGLHLEGRHDHHVVGVDVVGAGPGIERTGPLVERRRGRLLAEGFDRLDHEIRARLAHKGLIEARRHGCDDLFDTGDVSGLAAGRLRIVKPLIGAQERKERREVARETQPAHDGAHLAVQSRDLG